MDKLWFGVISLFPEMFASLTDFGISGRAVKNNRVDICYWNPRDFADNKHGNVDDQPYGGGPGMLIKTAPLRSTIAKAREAAPKNTPVVYLTPQGRMLNQSGVEDLSRSPGLILLAGRYEGIDERVIERDVDQQWSIGDYVLSGGELSAMVLMDALIRMLPGVVGDIDSIKSETFACGGLKFPQYTRPRVLDGQHVPEVLLSGNHARIQNWRRKQSLGRTATKRPDLLSEMQLSADDKQLLKEYLQEHGII